MSGWRLACLGILGASAALAAVWLQVQEVALGYRLSDLSSRAAALRDDQRLLEDAVARARRAATLEAKAADLGLALVTPTGEGIICLDWRNPGRARLLINSVPRERDLAIRRNRR